MATINGTTSTDYWTFKLEVTEGTANIENNTSSVKVEAYIGRRTVGSYMYGARIPCTVSCTGVSNKSFTYSNSSQVDIAAGGWLKIGDVTFSAVPHNADGSKTVTISASFTNNIKPASGSASGSVKLSTIPRASQPSLITYPENTQDVGKFGDTIAVHMNRKSSALKHTVRYEFKGKSGTIATNVENGVQWTIPKSLMNEIPANTKGSGRVYVDTYSGSTKIGEKYSGFTAHVPDDVKPSCKITFTDTTNLTKTYGKPVKGLSKLEITVTATKAYSSPIAAYSIKANGATYAKATATTGVLTSSGDMTITATVTDNRKRKDTKYATVNVLNYSPPSVTALSVRRCSDLNGTVNNQGGYIQATFSAKATNLSGNGNTNTATYVLSYKKSSDSTWNSVTLSDLNNNFAVSSYNYSFEADVNSSYDVKVTLTDRHNAENPATRSTSASTAFTLMNWHKSGTGMGIGKVAEKENALQVGLNTEIDKDLTVKGNQYIFGTRGVAETAGFIRMAQITHKTARADSPITFVFTRRQAPHPMFVHVQFAYSDTTDPALASISYEGNNYGAFLVKSATSVWDLYVEKISSADFITLQHWFSTQTTSDRLTIDFPGNLVSSVPQGLVGYYRATPAKLQSLVDFIYPVGSVYIANSQSYAPATMFGGTWSLIKKEFASSVESYDYGDSGIPFTFSSSVNGGAIYVIRSGQCMQIRLDFVPTSTLSDTTVTVGTLKLSTLGVTRLNQSIIGAMAYSDAANGIALLNVAYDSGEVTVNEIISKSSATTLASGQRYYCDLHITIPTSYMVDSKCDKFFWKRTA